MSALARTPKMPSSAAHLFTFYLQKKIKKLKIGLRFSSPHSLKLSHLEWREKATWGKLFTHYGPLTLLC